MVDKTTSIGILNPALNGLAHIYLVCQLIPACFCWELIDEASCVWADVASVGHVINLSTLDETCKSSAFHTQWVGDNSELREGIQ